MNKEYAIDNEKTDFELMTQFNDYLNLVELGQCPEKWHSDASGYTRDGRYINIELKQRNQVLLKNLTISGQTKEGKTYTASTIYAEAHKCGDLLLDYVCEQKEPLYINFLLNDIVIVYNLSRLKHRPNKVGKRIYSKLYEGFELAKREELEIKDAFIYKKEENNEYKLIHRP